MHKGTGMARLGRIVIMGAAVLALTAPALACSPLPYPPPPAPAAGTSPADAQALEAAWLQSHVAARAAEDREWALKQQTRLFDEAKGIALVRYDREGKVSGLPNEFDHMNGDPLAILKPVRWVKGTGAMTEITIGRGQLPPCGQMPAHDAFYGKPGEVFVIYLAADGHVMEGYRIDRIIEPRTLAALTAG